MANYLIRKEGKTKHDEHFDTYTMVGEIFQDEDKNKDGVLSYDELIGQPSEHDELYYFRIIHPFCALYGLVKKLGFSLTLPNKNFLTALNVLGIDHLMNG